jgi:hypothetical protein
MTKCTATWCPLCNRQFKTHMGLVVHYWRSVEHANPERQKLMLEKRAKRLPKQHEFKRLLP